VQGAIAGDPARCTRPAACTDGSVSSRSAESVVADAAAVAAGEAGVTAGPQLRGSYVVLTPVTAEHGPDLRRILRTPEVWRRWGDAGWPFDDPSATRFAVLLDGPVRGMVQYAEEDEPAYRHGSIDIFLDPAVHRAWGRPRRRGHAG
jgi:hypothetical protein